MFNNLKINFRNIYSSLAGKLYPIKFNTAMRINTAQLNPAGMPAGAERSGLRIELVSPAYEVMLKNSAEKIGIEQVSSLTPELISSLHKISNEAFNIPSTYSSVDPFPEANKTGFFALVARNEQQQEVGFLMGYFDYNKWFGQEIYHIDPIAITKKYQKRGLGPELLRLSYDRIRNKGYKRAYLYCEANLIGFYQKLGFHRVGSVADGAYMEILLS